MKQILFIALLAIAAISVKAQDTIYFNAKGTQVEIPDSAGFKSVTVADSADSSLYICKIYWMSGQIRKELRYKVENNDAVYVGRYAEWHPNGVLKLEANYVNGKKEGEEKTYEESGSLIERAFYEKGEVSKILDENGEESVYSFAEQMPQFPGGEKARKEFINSNIRYPVISLENSIQGTIIVRFEVVKTGEIAHISVLKGLDRYCNEEAKRVVSLMPKWIPGMQKGKPVSVWFIIPITYEINNNPVNRY